MKKYYNIPLHGTSNILSAAWSKCIYFGTESEKMENLTVMGQQKWHKL